MTESRGVQSLGWTRRTAAVSVLLVMDEHRKQAGVRLAELRDSQGLSQEELSHLAGVSVKTISRFENGRHDGRRSTVRAIAKALKVNEHDIVGEPPAPLGLGHDPYAELRSEVAALNAKLDLLLERVGGLDPADLTEQLTQHFEGLADKPPATGKAAPDTDKQSDAKPAPTPARAPRKRKSA